MKIGNKKVLSLILTFTVLLSFISWGSFNYCSLKHITALGQINADVNNSGDGVTTKDALSIQKYQLQLISNLPESYTYSIA